MSQPKKSNQINMENNKKIDMGDCTINTIDKSMVVNVTYNYNIRGLTVLDYDSELNMIHLTSDELNKILLAQNPYAAWFQIKHCNPDRQHYQNIYYDSNSSNKNSVWVYEKKKWHLQKFDTICDKIIEVQMKEFDDYMVYVRVKLDLMIMKKINDLYSLLDINYKHPKERTQKREIANLHEQIRLSLIKFENMIRNTYLQVQQTPKSFEELVKKETKPNDDSTVKKSSKKIVEENIKKSSKKIVESSDSEGTSKKYPKKKIIPADTGKKVAPTKKK